MSSSHKKISSLLSALTKLGHNKDDLILEIEKALKENDSPDDIITPTKKGLSIKVPLSVALKQLGVFKQLGINPNILDEEDDENEEDDEG